MNRLKINYRLRTKRGLSEHIVNIASGKHPETVYMIEFEENYNILGYAILLLQNLSTVKKSKNE